MPMTPTSGPVTITIDNGQPFTANVFDSSTVPDSCKADTFVSDRPLTLTGYMTTGGAVVDSDAARKWFARWRDAVLSRRAAKRKRRRSKQRRSSR